jgi:adenosylhomocysteine nucleosidase
MTKILICVALQSEFASSLLPNDFPIVYTGVGKINAALSTHHAIQIHKPKLIINYGTAGKISQRCHGLVNVNRVIQRDMNAEPLAPRGITPLSSGPHEFVRADEGFTCATGDSFVTAVDPWLTSHNVDVVDMELFAIAFAAYLNAIPWRAYKYITDEADDNAADHWQERVNHGADLFIDELRQLKII